MEKLIHQAKQAGLKYMTWLADKFPGAAVDISYRHHPWWTALQLIQGGFVLYALEWGEEYIINEWLWPYQIRAGDLDKDHTPWAVLFKDAFSLIGYQPPQ